MRKFLSTAAVLITLLAAAGPAPAQTADHLQCFKIKDAATKAKYAATLSPTHPLFAQAPGCEIKVPAKLLCIDAVKSAVVPAPPGAAEGLPAPSFLCYKAKCPVPASAPTPTANDQFGEHPVTVIKTQLVCAPIDTAVTTTSTTMAAQCAMATDCPPVGECAVRTCSAGFCGVGFVSSGTPTLTQAAGDCRQSQCNGTGGIVQANLDTDVPDDGNDCSSDFCSGGVAAHPPSTAGTPCTHNGGSYCDGSGNCVECNVPAQCPGGDTDCQSRTCSSGSCGASFAAANSPTATQTPGDCQQSVCDGAGGTTGIASNGDLPDDGQQCTDDVCTAGTPSNPFLPSGTPCSENGGTNCNASGSCVVATSFDFDGDGWSADTGDCCEFAACAAAPARVNPGAFEVVGNGIDDDCDAASSDLVAPAPCSSVAKFTGVTATDAANAMDLCQITSENPPLTQRKWGRISATHLTADGIPPAAPQLTSMRDVQTAVLQNYGTVILPRKGATAAGISSGAMRDQNDTGFTGVSTDLGYNGAAPPAYLAAHAGNYPPGTCGNVTCPTGSGANDPVNLRLRIRVPTNATSLSFDFRVFFADYQAFQCTAFNDHFLALLTSGTTGLPADHNMALESDGEPISLNGLSFTTCAQNGKSCSSCTAGTGDMAGTGMQTVNGGGNQWSVASAPVVPGETIVLDLMIFDVQDRQGDAVVLLDDLRWGIAP